MNDSDPRCESEKQNGGVDDFLSRQSEAQSAGDSDERRKWYIEEFQRREGKIRRRTKPWRYFVVLSYSLVGALFYVWAVGPDFFPEWLGLAFFVLFLASGVVGLIGWMATTRELRCPKCQWVVSNRINDRCLHCAVKLRLDGGTKPFQFSLRGLLLVMVIASIGSSWLGVRLNGARKNRQAAAEVRRIAAEIRSLGGSLSVRESRQAWLATLLADPGFVYADAFRVADKSKFGDEDIVILDSLGRSGLLGTLDFSSSQITDAGLVHLGELADLRPRHLLLHNTHITDSGMVHLQELTSLSELNLSNTQINDEGLVHLKGLADLRTLDLSRTSITDSGLLHVQGLARLQLLRLTGTQVTDGGLEHLDRLRSLRTLYLSGTQVTDEGEKRFQETLTDCKVFR